MKANDYNRDDWYDLFEYDETSPSGLVWKVPQYFRGTPNYSRVGKPVGSRTQSNDKSYWAVGLSNDYVRITYLLHRVIWVMKNGSVDPDNDIDHIDGDRLNNKIDNLRECSKSDNSRNLRKKANNTSGVTNVSRQQTKTSDGFRACVINQEGVVLRKFYSVNKYGESNAFDLACKWYKDKLEELDGAGYTERHGS